MYSAHSSAILMCWVTLGSAMARMSPGDWSGSLSDYGYTSESTMYQADYYTLAYLNFSYRDSDGMYQESTGEFGKYGEGKVMESSGIVVHVRNSDNATNHTGCSSKLFDGNIPKDQQWIALIQRGGCNFEDKVRNANEKGASAVVIYNDKESKTLDKMKLIDKNRNISAIFTYKEKGEELGQLADSNNKVFLNISASNRHYRNPGNMNRTSVLFVSISFILLMVMSISWLVFYYIQRFRYIHAKDRLSKRLCSAAKKALSKIPVKILKGDDKELQGDGECCAVCIEPYKLTDVLRMLPCRHDFHKSCIDPWLLEHRTCPMCKMDILKYYGFVFTGSQESILQLDMEDGDRRNTSPGSGSPDPHAAIETDSDHSERSSRASSPDELTPSLHSLPHSSAGIAITPEKRLQESKKHSEKSSSQSNFYILSEKNVGDKPYQVYDTTKTSHNKSFNSEPTTPSKSSTCIQETLENMSGDGENPSIKNKFILPGVHSSPSCGRMTASRLSNEM